MYLSMERKDLQMMIFNGHMFQSKINIGHNNGSRMSLVLQLVANLSLNKLPSLQVIIKKLEH